VFCDGSLVTLELREVEQCTVTLILPMLILYIYSPVIQTYIEQYDVHIMLLSTIEFFERRRREGRTFCTGIDGIILMHVALNHGKNALVKSAYFVTE
jgi:hypothetical protein